MLVSCFVCHVLPSSVERVEVEEDEVVKIISQEGTDELVRLEIVHLIKNFELKSNNELGVSGSKALKTFALYFSAGVVLGLTARLIADNCGLQR